MDAGQLVRSARRLARLSQREIAQRAGVSRSIVAAVESGRQSCSTATLDRLLSAASVDLVLAARLDPMDDQRLAHHLTLSLTQRLRIGLGETASIYAAARTQAWADLLGLARLGDVVLEPPLAHALWLPMGSVSVVRVRVHDSPHAGSPDKGHVLPPTTIHAERAEGARPLSYIPVALTMSDRVWVAPPAALAMVDHVTAALQRADRMLHQQSPTDDAGRRRPAHRDPDEKDEDWRLLVTKAAGGRRPDLRDSRAWRIGAAASLSQRLRAR